MITSKSKITKEAERRVPRGQRRATERGSTLILVLSVIAVLSVVAGNLLLSASSRYHVTYQSASWQEALVAAEAGIDLTMNELRLRVKQGESEAFQSPWLGGNASTGSGAARDLDLRLLGGAIDPTAVNFPTNPSLSPAYPDTGRALPLRRIAAHGGEGNQNAHVRVYVDVPGSDTTPGANFAVKPKATIDEFMNEQNDTAGADAKAYWWYRIRAVGQAGVNGPPRPSPDKRDNQLRRFSFLRDWRTGAPIAAGQPGHASRMIEVVARPLTGFRNALMANVQIDLNDATVLVDSYDSTHGLYGAAYSKDGKPYTNIGFKGNLATNGQLINAGGATVRGDALTNDGTVLADDKVDGQRRADFYQELSPVTTPQAAPSNGTWTLDGVQLNGETGAVSATPTRPIAFDGKGGYTVVGSTNRSAPTRVHLNGIDFSQVVSNLRLQAPAGHTGNSYVKLIVDGDIRVNGASTKGQSAIILDRGVHAIVYFTGDVALKGHGIVNVSKTPGQLLLSGVEPADANAARKTVRIETTRDFQGIVYAPDHNLQLALRAAEPSGGAGGGGGSAPASGTGPQTPTEWLAAARKLLDDNTFSPGRETNARKDFDKADTLINVDAKKHHEEAAKKLSEGDMAGYNNEKSKAKDKENEAMGNIDDGLNEVGKTRDDLRRQEDPASDHEAADHAAGYNGIYGAFVARTIGVESKTHVHYDEALTNAGPVNHYDIVNWFEDNVSRVPAGW